MSDDPLSADHWLRKIKASGSTVHNLHHRYEGLWVANLRTRKRAQVNPNNPSEVPLEYYAFGRGPDAAGALEAAYDNMIKGKKFKGVVVDDDERLPSDPCMDGDADDLGLDDILGDLPADILDLV